MECAEINSYLSEYLDGALDAQTMNLVQKHLMTCKKCKEAFESLQSVVLELGDLDPIKAPHDFLEQLHDRLAKRFSLKELTKRLFVPFKVKIPLQFATAVAMAILIFSVIHTPEIEKEMAGIPKKEGSTEKVDELGAENVLKAEQKKETPAPAAEVIKPGSPLPEEQLAGLSRQTPPVKIASRSKTTTAEPLSQGKSYLRQPADEETGAEPEPSVNEASKQVEIVIVLKSEVSMLDETSQLDRKKKGLLSSERGVTGSFRDSDAWKAARTSSSPTTKKDSIEEDRALGYLAEEELKSKEEPFSKVLSPDEVLPMIRDLINNVKGTVLSTEYNQNTNQLKSLHAEMPAVQYGFFCEKLKQLGNFQSSIPAVEGTGPERIKIRIRFIHS